MSQIYYKESLKSGSCPENILSACRGVLLIAGGFSDNNADRVLLAQKILTGIGRVKST
jgi:hypothetical protein